MMTIYSQKLVEGEPAALPAVADLSPAAAAIPQRLVWDRMEGWTGGRFGLRSAEWFVTGHGYWQPSVEPWQIDAVAEWDGAAELWVPRELAWTPDRGYPLGRFENLARWRMVGTVGSADLPGEPFLTAYRRFAEYLAAGQAQETAQLWMPGVTSISVSDGAVQTAMRRDPNWLASAWQVSGAADALRYHRRPR